MTTVYLCWLWQDCSKSSSSSKKERKKQTNKQTNKRSFGFGSL